MRALKVLTIVMGVLIFVASAVLVFIILRRASKPTAPAAVAALLHEPPGTRILGIAAVQDRLAVLLQGGGADRVVLVDPLSGAVTGRIALAP